jgi:hypothetical protein
MKTKSLFLLLALLVILPGVSSAQIGALRRAINRQIDNKIDSAVDKSAKENAAKKEQADKQQSDKSASSTSGGAGTKATGRGLFGGKIDIKYDDEYKFTGRIYMQMETHDKKDVIKSDYYTYFNANTSNAGIEVKVQETKDGNKPVPTVFLFDHDNKCLMLLLDNGDSKTGMISTMPSDSALAEQTKTQKVQASDQPTITKTGNSRIIAGYKCDEYKITEKDKDGFSLVWMTKDVKLKADKRYWGKAGMPTFYNYPGFEGAMMLAMETYDKNNQPGMKMETKEINEKFNYSISTTGYTFMKINFGQAGKK